MQVKKDLGPAFLSASALEGALLDNSDAHGFATEVPPASKARREMSLPAMTLIIIVCGGKLSPVPFTCVVQVLTVSFPNF